MRFIEPPSGLRLTIQCHGVIDTPMTTTQYRLTFASSTRCGIIPCESIEAGREQAKRLPSGTLARLERSFAGQWVAASSTFEV